LEIANERGVVIASKVLMRYERGWHHLISIEELQKIRRGDYKEYKEIMGKYLLFSSDLVGLIEIAVKEILQHNFHVAKVNSRLLGKSTEYVLCLYYKNDTRKHELAERCKTDYPEVKYRYCKSDESTKKGKYSQEFLNKLDPETRKQFIDGNGTIAFQQ
jgi:hypothetical protein